MHRQDQEGPNLLCHRGFGELGELAGAFTTMATELAAVDALSGGSQQSGTLLRASGGDDRRGWLSPGGLTEDLAPIGPVPVPEGGGPRAQQRIDEALPVFVVPVLQG